MVLRQLSPPTPAGNSVPTRVNGYIPCAFGDTIIPALCFTTVNASLYVLPGILTLAIGPRPSGPCPPEPEMSGEPYSAGHLQGNNISESDCVTSFCY